MCFTLNFIPNRQLFKVFMSAIKPKMEGQDKAAGRNVLLEDGKEKQSKIYNSKDIFRYLAVRLESAGGKHNGQQCGVWMRPRPSTSPSTAVSGSTFSGSAASTCFAVCGCDLSLLVRGGNGP